MKTMLQAVKTKLFLFAFLLGSTLIVATTVTITVSNNEKKGLVLDKIENKVEKKKVNRKSINQQLRNNTSQLKNNLFRNASTYFEATLTSDAPDYTPFSTAIF